MPKRSTHVVTIIRKSLLTGKAVWLYRGSGTKTAVWNAYDRARRRELERARNWGERMSRRKANILRMLNDCMSGVPINEKLTPEMEDAARRLASLAEKGTSDNQDFFNHITEERRRRKR